MAFRSRIAGSVAVAVLTSAGCTPALDWRAVELPGTALVADMPCRPGRFQRELVVAGTPLTLFLMSCEAAGVTYGIATADVGDPTRVDPVLDGVLGDGCAGCGSCAGRPSHRVRYAGRDTVSWERQCAPAGAAS